MGQDPTVSYIAGTYILSYIPALYVLGLIDFDRVLMINIGLSLEAMYCQIATPFLHFMFCYLITIHFQFGIVGAGFSGVITNLLIFTIQIYILRRH